MHGLLIAEKPSVMRAVEAVYKKDPSKYPFSLDFAAFHGHLMQLLDPEDYDPSWSNWSMLPVIPAAFRYKAADVKSVDALTAKIKQGKYDFLVNACDAGREGEHIFWSFYETQRLTTPVKRFWVSSVTASALKKALSDLKDSSNYNGLRQSAKYRAQLDWLVGMNFTRAATNKKGDLTSIGRVQTPVLKLIVDREMQIRNFKPEDFYELKGTFKVNGAEFVATHLIAPDHKGTRFGRKEDASIIEAAVKNKAPGIIAASKNEVKPVPAPTLFSLTELQKAANRMLKFKPDKTLSIAQKLYEGGLLTYPRTESRFLPTDMIPEIPAHIKPLALVPELASFATGIGQAEIDRMLKGKYVDDAGITDHHAIIPTDQPPNWESLSKDEQAIYSLVGKSFLAIFLPPYQAAVSAILVDVGGHLFRARGSTEIDPGYTILYPKKAKKSAGLPVCKKGDKAALSKIGVAKGTTKPPERYNPETILSAMKNAGQDLPDSLMRSTLREAEGLGTPATRADILSKLETREYVKLEKNVYYALDKGIRLVEDVGSRPFSSAALTAEWEEKLQSIEKGKYTGNFRQEMETFVTDETAYLLGTITGTFGNVIGKCPFCGGEIADCGKGYGCRNYKKDDPSSCKVWIPKVAAGYALTEKDLQDLLAGKETQVKTFTNKGKTWNAALVLDKEKGAQFKFPEYPIIGLCPCCGSMVRNYNNFISCEKRKREDANSCKFWVSRTVSGCALTDEDISVILSGKPTSIKHFSTKEKEWDASLLADKEKGVIFQFPERKVVGKCPLCGNPVYAGENNFYCSSGADQCKWSFPRTIKGTALKDGDVATMLKGNRTRFITFTWSSGKQGDASLYFVDGKLKWAFN